MSEGSTKTTASGGIGFAGLLTIAFIVLKLTNVITWSWWWVLAPLWMSVSIFLVLAALFVLIAVVVGNKT